MSGGRVFVGLDVGGTQVKGGAIRADELDRLDPEQVVGRTVTRDTDLERGASDLLDRLAAFARELGADGPLGLGCPGVYDGRSGVLLRSANLKVLEGVHLARELARRLDLEPPSVAVGNDADLAAYGEQWLGAGRGIDDLVMLTLGTGIGSGIVLAGELFTGSGGRGAEVGHMVVRARRHDEPQEPGLRCGCGAYGCLERLASASAARRRAVAAGLTPDLEQLARRARDSDGPERALLRAIGRDLGAGLLALTALLDVGTYVIGGGFGGALDLLRPGIQEVLAERDYGRDPPRLLSAQLGAAAGWIGAARLAAYTPPHGLVSRP